MVKARASFLAKNSLSALFKVCSSSVPSSLIKHVALIKYLSTAAKRLELQDENYSARGQDPCGFLGGAPGPVGFNGVEVNSVEGFLDRFSARYGGGPGGFSVGAGSFQGFHGNPNGAVECYYGNGNVSVLNRGGYWPNGDIAHNPQEGLAECVASNAGGSPFERLDELCAKGEMKEAVEVVRYLEMQHVFFDMSRILKLIEACGEAKKLEEARAVHDHLTRFSYPLQIGDYNKILEMYGKCGAMEDAFLVFNGMQQRNLTTWDTMTIWLAKNGLGEDAIDLFSQFKTAGFKPDAEMFNGIFYVCGTLGDMQEGLLHLESMEKDYAIVPSMNNYKCIVDMVAGDGYLEEALQFIEEMPTKASVDIWETLMEFCRVHGNFPLGDYCAEIVDQLDPSCLEEQCKTGFITAKVLGLLEEKGDNKSVDQNLLSLRSGAHQYRAGDTSDPDSDKIYALLRSLKNQMKEVGYIADTKFVLHDIDEESKEEAIHAHSERLAAAQALLRSGARSPVRIMKNLRSCVDCHNALKIISKIVGRTFIIRDAKQFHHIENGDCTCNDYW